ncbi:putative thymidylate synthase [Pseudomonas phage phiPMW]|uniref:Putative thymidylate synthase n=1 Tax=Pseudomonas phage phiPMW TaxID=1815582 RepID=A0A1S5R1S8_9CAUD|nr:putative thymidylate synthase [Pseudomonas phage phiPMW]ANA49354.1 putative thymidylate synthase [Pseudomonas phage phiPMW]
MIQKPTAKMIADSISSITGIRMMTIQVDMPRIVLAELNTHSALCKNTSSSRAIPVPTLIKQVRDNPAMPVRFGAANKGMQDAGPHNALIEYLGGELTAEEFWIESAHHAAYFAETLHEAGYAKQVCNRVTEPYQWSRVVLSGTDWENFKWLRNHYMADPTIEAVAIAIEEAMAQSTPVVLNPGEWHVPYYNDGIWKPIPSKQVTYDGLIDVDKFGHSLEHALMISSSCCAQASYRQLDDTVEKATRVSANLNLRGEQPDEPVHASPLEHQATPVQQNHIYQGATEILEVNGGRPSTWEKGITHMRRDGTLCSGQLRGWVQYRQLVPNNVKNG